jgi:hypothetical protein
MGTRQTFENGLRRCGSDVLMRTSCRRGSLAGLLALGLAVMLSGPIAIASAEAPCPNEQFRTGAAAGLPDCRAYELVSPAEKQGGEVYFPAAVWGGVQFPSVIGSSADGEQVMYYSFQAFAGAPSAVLESYVATRGASGWSSTSITPTPTVAHPWLLDNTPVIDVTSDFSRAIVRATYPLDPLDQRDPATDLYLREADGSLSWLSRGNGEGPETESAEPSTTYAGRSADASEVFFESGLKLVPADSGMEAGGSLYERAGGHTELVNVNNEGSLLSGCGAMLGGKSESYKAVSEDGSRVYFTAPDPTQSLNFGVASCQVPARVYLREGGRTIDISQSQRTVADPVGTEPAYFQGASADGSRAFFTSTEALTDEARSTMGTASLLYEYNALSGRLKLLTPDEGEPAPNVVGSTAISADGSHVYFVNDVPTGAGGGAVEPLLEMYSEGRITPIADVPLGSIGADGGAIGLAGGEVGGSEPEGGREVRLSADGLHLLFGDRDNLTSFNSHGHQELYLYDAVANTLTCVSCNSDGHVPLGEADLTSDVAPYQGRRYMLSANITADGSRVFFETPDNLVGQDTNGVMDVYEWEGGRDYLISDGHASNPSYFVGSGEEGRDVFFATAEGLLAADTDHGDNDIYDARIDGGFAETAPPTPACGGSGCQEQQSSTTPAFAVIGSAAAQGQGNLAPPPAAKPKPKPKPKPRCRKHKSSCPRHKAPSAKRKVGAVNHGKPRSAGR